LIVKLTLLLSWAALLAFQVTRTLALLVDFGPTTVQL
jgi:hypothetical protein